MVETVVHRRIKVAGADAFYRESGPAGAPVLLLPHGYPASSFAYRRLLPALGDTWRVVAPDFPGSGYSEDPEEFEYSFDGFAAWLDEFVEALGITRHGLWLHDFGSQIGLRYAIARPERITAIVISNGDIYEDTLGPGYDVLRRYWSEPTPENFAPIRAAISRDGFRHEVLNDVGPDLAERIAPEMWELHWALMTDRRKEIAASVIAGLRENVTWFPRYQKYLREAQHPALVLWGENDEYMPRESALAYARDLPDAEFHILDAGHWVLETHFEECLRLLRPFFTTHLL
jgi:pimeloyl-ACP methyl ester carboxylesterase